MPNQSAKLIPGFLSINDLVNSQGELVITMEYDSKTKEMFIVSCAPLPSNSKPADIAAAYLSLCDCDSVSLSSFFLSHTGDLDRTQPELRTVDRTYTILNA